MGPFVFGGDEPGALARVLYTGGDFRIGGDGPRIVVLYSLVPWVGLIALGYAFGRIVAMPAAARDRWCVRIGVAATLAFLVLRGFNIYGDPRPWNPAPPGAVSPLAPLFSFLNTAKYPASLLFLLMTLGPSIAAMPLLERWRGWMGHALEVFGRVPLFYYLLHIPAIHVAAIVVSLVRSGAVSPWLFSNHPMEPGPPPPGAVWSLPLLYLVTAVVVTLLYFPCRWYADVKAKRPHWAVSML